MREAHRVVSRRDPNIASSSDGPSSSDVPGLKILHSLASGTSLTALRNMRFNLDTAALYLLKLLSEASFDPQVSQKESDGGKEVERIIKYRYSFHDCE